MGLQTPAALYLLALIPALLAAYLARERPRQVIVSSVLALRALRTMRGERFGGRPRLSWPFWLELLALILAAVALAHPYILQHGSPIAVIIDNSAAMQARTSSGTSRYDATITRLTPTLQGMPSTTKVTVYATSPQPHPLGAPYDSPAAALDAIKRVRVTDVPANLTAMAELVRQLLGDKRLGQVIVASSHRVEGSGSARLISIAVSPPTANYAIGRFTVEGGGLGSNMVRARISVANFSQSAQTLHVAVTADGKAAGATSAMIGAGKAEMLEIPNLPPAKVYQAQLTPTDGFNLDNSAYAVLPAQRQIKILFVSPTPTDGQSLRLIPGVAVATRSPDAYTPHDLAAADVAIFEYTVPKELPSINTLLIMPPPDDPVFGFRTESAPQIELTAWPMTDQLTDGVNLRLLNVRSGEYFAQHPWMAPVIEGASGGLLLRGTRGGNRYIATGFNPLPYLGKANLPMSILTLNLLADLAGLNAPSQSFRTGEQWEIPSGVRQIELPSGARVNVSAGAIFRVADTQGIYQLIGNGATALRAVNLGDLAVSDLASEQPLRVESGVAPSSSAGASVTTNLMPWLLVIALGLILLEAFLVYRAPRAIAEV